MSKSTPRRSVSNSRRKYRTGKTAPGPVDRTDERKRHAENEQLLGIRAALPDRVGGAETLRLPRNKTVAKIRSSYAGKFAKYC
jgi:hypothetical protein